MVQFSFSVSSSGNSLPGTTCSLDRLLPPWTWCQRRGFWALLRLCKPRDEVPGPLTLSAECWLLPNAGTNLSLVKNVSQERGQCWGTQAQQLDCLHFNPALPTVTLAKWPHYSEPMDLKQYLADNQQSKPWHLWSWCVLLFYHGIRHFLKNISF